jgi:hypothetical protein
MVGLDDEVGAGYGHRPVAPVRHNLFAQSRSLATNSGDLVSISQYLNRYRAILYGYCFLQGLLDLFLTSRYFPRDGPAKYLDCAPVSPDSRPGRVYGAIAITDDDDVLADKGVSHQVQGQEQRNAVHNPLDFLAWYVQTVILVSAYGQEEGPIATLFQIGKGYIAPDRYSGSYVDPHRLNGLNFSLAHLFGQSKTGNAGGQHSADNAVSLEHHRRVPSARQFPGGRKSGWASTDYSYLFRIRVRTFTLVGNSTGRIIGRVAVERPYEHRAVEFTSAALELTGMSADPSQCRGKGRHFIDQRQRFVCLPVGQQGDKALDIYAQGTGDLAGSKPVLLNDVCRWYRLARKKRGMYGCVWNPLAAY